MVKTGQVRVVSAGSKSPVGKPRRASLFIALPSLSSGWLNTNAKCYCTSLSF